MAKISKHQNEALEKRIIEIIKENNTLSQIEIAEKTGTSRATVQRAMKKLANTGRISRKAGKRYGYWEV